MTAPVVAVAIGGERALEQLGQPLADCRLGVLAMHETGEIADLLGAVVAAGGRHLGPLVPFESAWVDLSSATSREWLVRRS